MLFKNPFNQLIVSIETGVYEAALTVSVLQLFNVEVFDPVGSIA